MSDKIIKWGQVFTPDLIVERMLSMRQNKGTVLEPSAGIGVFWKAIEGCVGIEIDKDICPIGCLNQDFFTYPTSNKFDSVIGNPPYVAFKNILDITKENLFSYCNLGEKANLYLYFIRKCFDHLNEGGEMIFITPREFVNATSSRSLNELLYNHGTITHFFDEGEKRIFLDAQPNCCIWRYEKGNMSHTTETYSGVKSNKLINGQLLFTNLVYSVKFSDVFLPKVGGVSGMDEIYTSEQGNYDFVVSSTNTTGKTRRMIYDDEQPHALLIKHRLLLKNRKIKSYSDYDWWTWGRPMMTSESNRIYVNHKTRSDRPFFIHQCKNWDGSVLALFLRNQLADRIELTKMLNESVNWSELGFKVGGRYIFNQKSLQNSLLPECFKKFRGTDSINFFILGSRHDDYVAF